MSSFRRSAPRSNAPQGAVGNAPVPFKRALPGTKPFVNGQTLVSSGLAQLDAIVGGGWFLGTIVLLDVPRGDIAAGSTRIVDDLHRYFLAEGVVSGQGVLVVSEDAHGFGAQLPLELSTAQKQVKAQLATGVKDKDDQLTIAWQYQKYIASDNAGSVQRFCHSFDLSRAMHTELLQANPPTLLSIDEFDNSSCDGGIGAYQSLFRRLQQEIATHAGERVVRVSIQELGSPIIGPPSHEHMKELFMFVQRVHRLCALVHDLVVQLSGHFYAFPVEFCYQLKHIADYVLEVKSFVGENDLLPGELVEFNGLLDIKKLARCHALACHSMDAVKFGIKRERRKMKIEKFHLPPEGSRSSNDKNKASAGKSNLVASSFTKVKSSSAGCGDHSGRVDPYEF